MIALKKPDLILLRLEMLKAGYGLEDIEQFVRGVVAYGSLAHSKLEEQLTTLRSEVSPADKADLELALDDEHYFIGEAKKLAHELSIVALYKKLEITVGRAVKIAYPNAPEKKLFKFDHLKDFLKEQGIDASQLSGYTGMNEARVLNNAIKHSGSVSKELAKFPGWKKGDPLSELDKAFGRLAPPSMDYVKALLDALIAQRRKALGH